MHTNKNISSSGIWLYGAHAVQYALLNAQRRVLRLLLTKEAESSFEYEKFIGKRKIKPEIVDRGLIEKFCGRDAVHQGIAALCEGLPPLELQELIQNLDKNAIIVVLDQVTDPHNVGAILRSCAAFNVNALIIPDKNSPPLSGVLAKASCGGLELVPVLKVVNLSQALEQLKQGGFWCLALDPAGEKTLAESKNFDRIAIVFGAEGEGLRRLTKESCDIMVRLPMQRDIGSINVSNAAAISLYELNRE